MTQTGKEVSALKVVSPEDKLVSLLATLTCPPGPLVPSSLTPLEDPEYMAHQGEIGKRSRAHSMDFTDTPVSQVTI